MPTALKTDFDSGHYGKYLGYFHILHFEQQSVAFNWKRNVAECLTKQCVIRSAALMQR